VLDPGDIIFVVKGTTNRGQDRKKTCCVYYQNVRGLRSKTQLFRNNVEQYSYDFIALTETFLTSSVCNGELFPPGYRVIRQDRIGDTGWGGVLLAVKESYSVHVLNNVDGLTRDKELVFVIITTKNIKLLCCVAYLPPNYKDEQCPLLHIFNLALQHSNFPECWKLSKVTPVPKGEAGGQASNYRPIAVLSVFGKVFESVVNRLLMNQISSKLHSSQHGFRQARSTTTNLVTLVDYIHREMDAGRQVDATYFDFRKAFDLVDNDILLEKLAKIGFVPNLLKFFCSYLGDRRQFVKINGYESDCYFTRSGVSQGSTLGPTLFLIMINDLPLTVHTSTCLMFADDLKLCLGIRDARDSVALQNDVNAVATWSLANNLPFNDTKCKAITFSRKRSPIDFTYTLNDLPLQRVLDIRDLGLVIDSKLDLHKHMTNICKNASKLLGFIIRTAKNFDDIRVARVLFNTLVRSRLEYASVVWDPYEDKYRLMIERIQRKFSRWLYAKRYGHYPYLYPSLFVSGMVDLETLALRREMNRIVLYLSIIHNKIDSPAVIERINLAIPTRLPSDSSGMIAPRRRPRLLERPVTRTKSAAHAPTTRALIILGDILAQNADLDLFADGLSYLCNKIYVYLSTC
jgi:hypothetical protein